MFTETNSIEYIWEGNLILGKHSVLFPIVGTLNNAFNYNDATYRFIKTWFYRDMVFELIDKAENSATFFDSSIR
jgi:hypothetical protein